MDDPDLPRYLLIAALVLAPIAILIWLRERHMSARTRVLREILDHADALESELQECRSRLREIPALVSRLPPSASLSARATLAAEPEVQAALHDLLQHRLWLKQFGADASLDTCCRSACKALEQSRSKLSTQLERLEQVREELASAGSNLETP
jgi:DNA repair ATPase RecN